jgi:Holliday junction DNA helicase RuvA
MIGHLRGRVLRKDPERVLLEVGGVGYEVWVPVSTYVEIERAQAAASADEPIALHVHTHVREDVLALFGFWTEREKFLFEKLIAVSGIGPRLARVILSGMSPDDLIAALAGKDSKVLATIPGVGRKTAERMVLELSDKVEALAAQLPERAAAAAGDEDVVSALANLGYKRSQAEKAVAQTRRDNPDGEFPELLRESLKRLTRV